MNQLSFFDITEEKKIEKPTEIREIRCGRLFVNGKFVPKFKVGDKVMIINKIVKCSWEIGVVTKTYGPFCYIDNHCIAWDQDELELVE